MATKKAYTAPPYPLLFVEWEDHAGSDGWTALDDAIRSNDDSTLCQTVGWLIAENRERITVASSIGPANDVKPKPDCAGQMTIAKALIKTRHVITMKG
jgi:hypothetical protein